MRAESQQFEATVTSDGTETDVVFGDASDGWIECGWAIRLGAAADVGAAGCDFVIYGKKTANAPTETLQTATTVASDGTITPAGSALDIEAYHYVKISENGTDGQTQTVYLGLK